MRHATFLLLGSLMACGSSGVSGTAPDPIVDGSGDETNDGEVGPTADTSIDSTPTDSGPPACNTLDNGGAVIDETVVDGTAPTFVGGTIAPGTYVLSKYEIFTPGGTPGTTGNTLKQTMEITATTLAIVFSNNRGPNRRGASTYTSPSKTTLYVTDTCGSTDKYFFGYEATPTTLKFGSGSASAYYVLSFDKK